MMAAIVRKKAIEMSTACGGIPTSYGGGTVVDAPSRLMMVSEPSGPRILTVRHEILERHRSGFGPRQEPDSGSSSPARPGSSRSRSIEVWSLVGHLISKRSLPPRRKLSICERKRRPSDQHPARQFRISLVLKPSGRSRGSIFQPKANPCEPIPSSSLSPVPCFAPDPSHPSSPHRSTPPRSPDSAGDR